MFDFDFLRVPQTLVNNRQVLLAASAIEIRRKYAGTLFGLVWSALYPISFLLIYLFVYLIVLGVKFPQFSNLEYALFVFSGLVPYVSLMEGLSHSAHCIRQHINLVTNRILPLELLPARVVAMAYIGQFVGICFLITLSAISGNVTWKLLTLPVAMGIFALTMLGLVYTLSILGIILPDLNQLIGLVLLLLMFISPIAFLPTMVPSNLDFFGFCEPYFLSTGTISVGDFRRLCHAR